MFNGMVYMDIKYFMLYKKTGNTRKKRQAMLTIKNFLKKSFVVTVNLI